MIKTFTHNDLILYVYNELPDEVKTQLEKTLRTDLELAEECAELLVSKRQLENFSKGPGSKCIDNILRYSQNLSMLS